MIDRKDLITFKKFNQMTFENQKKYIADIFGDSSIKVLAEIEKMDSTFVWLHLTNFIFQDGLQEFELFKNDSFSRVVYDKKGSLKKFCDEYNPSKGNQLVYKIYLTARSTFNYVDNSFEMLDKQKLIEIYKKNKFLNKNLSNNLTLEDIDIQLQKSIDKKISELNRLYNRSNELKKLNDNAENEYKKKIQIQKQRLTESLNQLQRLVAEKDSEFEKLRQEKFSLEEKLKSIRKCLRIYGVSFSDKDSTTETVTAENLKKIDEFDEMIEYWQSHLNTEKYGFLKYDKQILESLYFGLQTDQLILLMGNPGTGKTSLVKAIAKSFDFADAAIIPVQSNWTDKSDLLGYYNPLEKNYVSTPFLDALINFSRQAVQNPEKLFIICLDEMNLAHVEYYFAEFLSILQDNDNAEITLYSEQLRKDILYELQNSGFKMDGDKILYEGTPLENLSLLERKYYFELRRLAQMLINYPAKFKIPKNVKFFGTLNQDETTLDISPKVLDRSYVIRIERFFEDEEIPIGEETPIHYKPLEDYAGSDKNGEYWDIIASMIEDLKNNLKKVEYLIHISHRVTDKIIGHKNFLDWAGVMQDFTDYIIASCVLPKLRLDEKNYDNFTVEIEELIALNCNLSYEILQRINSPEEKTADFWRR